MSDLELGTTLAPSGQIWICGACGKRARTRYGFDSQNRSTAIDPGWDESCMLKASLCYETGKPVEGKDD